MKLNHHNLVTNDVQASLDFYKIYFNFKELFEAHGEIFLIGEGSYLLALQATDSPVETPRWFHFGFCVDSANQVKNLYKKMKSDGVKFYEDLSTKDGKFAVFYAFDPAGHRVEVSWHNI
jgi:catechol 2,3-dioxygenase-like lactoylglutathione lyase family enzyme